MADDQNHPSITAAVVIGVCLLIGLTAGGYFIGRGATRFKSDARTVTVKGLVEKEVKADEAIWSLSLRRASDDIKDAHGKISADRDRVFAKAQLQRQREYHADSRERAHRSQKRRAT